MPQILIRGKDMQKRRVRRHEVIQPLDQSIKLIPLTKGQNVIVDAADYDWLMQWNWSVLASASGFYAVRHEQGRAILMHRELTRNEGKSTDHKNRNTLDNRKSNLRPCDQSLNQANRIKESINTSGYKGVKNHRDRWQAMIWRKGVCLYLGTFVSKDDAARAYDKAAIELFGEFAHLNFQNLSPKN
jgi:hypothetical protein